MPSTVLCPTCGRPGLSGSYINCGCLKQSVKIITSLPTREDVKRRLKQSEVAARVKAELPIWQIERYAKCKECPSYLHVEREEQCAELPSGRNYLWRQRGIPSKKAKCPIGKWRVYVEPVAKKLLNKTIPKWHYITVDEMSRDVVAMTNKLPPIRGVAGVPVSGMLAAPLISTLLHIPLYEASDQHGIRALGHGLRGDTRDVNPDLPILIIDDTVSRGGAMQRLKQKLPKGQYLFAAVYAKNSGMHELDLYGAQFEEPHLLEWNIANTGYILGIAPDSDVGGAGIAFDLDGVICEDPPREFNERDVNDRREYLSWIANARLGPIVPRMYEVPLIVSYRCEYTRLATETWLARNGVRYKELRLWPDSVGSRTFDGSWKAKAYAERNFGLFVESSQPQAKAIAQMTGKRVLCTDTRKVY